jgi:ornithine carbamoyltransferase
MTVYPDVRASLGQADEAHARRQVFEPDRVTPERFATTADGAVFRHGLPA